MENYQAYGLLVLSAVDPHSDLDLTVFQQPKEQRRLVSARDLHKELQIGKDFSTWIKERIGKHRFTHEVDYVMLEADKTLLPKIGEQKKEKRGGSNKREYALSLDAAKMIAMGTNNKVGDKVKRYFLYCEKKALLPYQQPITPLAFEHTSPSFQRKQTRALTQFLSQHGGVRAVVDHHRSTCQAQTGFTPAEVKQIGREAGLAPGQCTSARQVMRELAPAVACAMSLSDTMVLFGAPKKQALELAAEHQDLFLGMMEMGLVPAESQKRTRAVGTGLPRRLY